MTRSGTTLVLMPPLISPTVSCGLPMPVDVRATFRQRFAPGVEVAQDVVRGLERVDAGEGHRGVRGAAVDLHLEMQAAIVGVDHGVGEAGAEREVGFADALLDQPARADLAARLLVVGEVQLDRPASFAPAASAACRASRAKA